MIIDPASPGRRYFTVRELLVVVTIIAISFAVLVPAIRKGRDDAHRTDCKKNLWQIGSAIQNYHDLRQEICPSYVTDDHSPAAIPHAFPSWSVLIGSYFQVPSIFPEFELSVPFDGPSATAEHASVAVTRIWFYTCPSRRTTESLLGTAIPVGDYGCVTLAQMSALYSVDRHVPRSWDGAIVACRAFNASTMPNTVPLFGFEPGTLGGREFRSMTSFASVTDGLSNTALIGEKAVHQDRFGGLKTDLAKAVLPSEPDGTFYFGRGGNPGDLKVPGAMAYWSRRLAPAETGERLLPAKPRLEHPNNRFGGWHPGVTLFLLGDGSVKAVSNDTSTIVLQRLGCRNDGQKVELP